MPGFWQHVLLLVETTGRSVSMGADNKLGNKVKGKAKEAAGDVSGDEQLQTEGQTDQTKGNVKQAGEKVKDAFKS
jgi:uncharacterized protein YjbJ (UPF0337 family)